jgi:hypothetical protein
MDAFTLIQVFNSIKSDKSYLADRSTLHHNYEAIEGFWRRRFFDKVDPFDQFIKEYGPALWQSNRIKALATQFASLECVGSSNTGDFYQTEEIAKATMYLRYHSHLFKKNSPSCESIGCRNHKKGSGLCSMAKGRQWTRKDHPYSSFKAFMYILRQVRNNLFHGSKFSMEQQQYKRDKKLVALSAKATTLILENLSRAVNKSFS